MFRSILGGVVLAMAIGAWGQTAPTAPITSNGPVVVDYGRQSQSGDPVENQIAKEVRHELLMLPHYSLFDDLEFSVQGRTVTLSGSLTGAHAITKSDAENAVKHIEGVDQVINNIKILPVSPLDDEIREQTFRALSGAGSLSQYFWEAAPSIHIIVDNQRVTLAGFVNSEGDKNLAGITANGVPNVFKVTNNLRIAGS